MDGPSYKKLLLSRSGRGSVGVDVLCIGGGVFFCFCKTVWVRCLVLEDCLVIGGYSCGFVFRMTLHSIFLRSEFEDMYDLFDIAQQYLEYVFLRFVLIKSRSHSGGWACKSSFPFQV